MKPMLAETWDEARQRFPVYAQPKIDGVRALNITGKLTGRSLKTFKNEHVTKLLSHSALYGFDGELAAEAETHPELCRLTSSALGTIKGQPFVLWHLFDYVTPETRELPYHKRLAALRDRVEVLRTEQPELAKHLRVIKSCECTHAAALAHFESQWLEQGYEGVILRDPYGLHKDGRVTVREGTFLRIKRFVDFEFVVEEIIEGDENQNEAQTNELGQTFRTSHQANKVPNGMVGSMVGRVLEDVVSDGEVLFPKGSKVTVGAGRLTHDQRREFFQRPALLMAMVSKAKFFPKGIKDKPRFPTWQSFREAEDRS